MASTRGQRPGSLCTPSPGFPPPSLNLSQLEVSELTVVSVECKAHAGAVVMLSGAPAGPPAPSAQFQLNVTAEDNGHSFLCSAVLEVAGEVLYKNETLKLSVLYGPQLNEKDCPGNWTWQEGSQQTLRCQASGNPTPKLDCRQNGTGSLLPIGDLHPVKREIAGTYVCRAKSSRGEVIRQVIVNVICECAGVLGWAGQGRGSEPSSTLIIPYCFHRPR